MSRPKTVLFVPGFPENETSRNYTATIQAIEKCGYKVRFVPINWKRTVLTDWVAQLNEVYKDYDPDQTILAGFSFGAMTVFVAAAARQPSGLWLFSLSPFFAEDLPNIKSWELKRLGKRRVAVANETSFDVLSQNITCPVRLFVGDDELRRWPEMHFRTYDAAQKIANATLTIIGNIGHDVAHQKYTAAITDSIMNR